MQLLLQEALQPLTSPRLANQVHASQDKKPPMGGFFLA